MPFAALFFFFRQWATNKSNHMKASALSAPQRLTIYVLTMSTTGQWCQSGHQENSLPDPLLGQPHHHHHATANPCCPPLSNPWGATTATTLEVEVSHCVLYLSEKGRQSSLSLWVTLPLCVLRSFPQPPRSLQHCSTLTAWETRTEKEEGGGVTQLLPHCAICPALSMTGALQKEQLSICKSTYSLSFFTHTDIHITDSHNTHLQKGEQNKSRQLGVNRGYMRCERQQWKCYDLMPQTYKHYACQEGHRSWSRN